MSSRLRSSLDIQMEMPCAVTHPSQAFLGETSTGDKHLIFKTMGLNEITSEELID